MKRHIGDRRGRARFEIVGRLIGSLETRERWAIRNMGEGGALVETTVPLAPGGRVTGRLFFRGMSREVRGEARHIATAEARGEAVRYLVGVQWGESVNVADFVSMVPMRAAQTKFEPGLDRRAAVRVVPGPDAEIGQTRWSTVDVIDISTAGVLIASQQPLDLGETGELRVRLGGHSFAAQIEVRRTDARRTPGMNHGIGAKFVSLNESNRLHLEDFIGDQR